jgi:hypothetical protein
LLIEEEEQYGSGRTVSLEYFLQAHPSAIKNVFRLAEEYRDTPEVHFTYMDNTHGFGKSREITREQAQKIEFQQVEGRARAILEQEYRDGRISKKIYTGIKLGKDVP